MGTPLAYQEACLSDARCSFAVFKTTRGACSAFSSCSQTQEQADFLVWMKITDRASRLARQVVLLRLCHFAVLPSALVMVSTAAHLWRRPRQIQWRGAHKALSSSAVSPRRGCAIGITRFFLQNPRLS